MAFIEMNALSTVLCGSFSAKVFLPEMDKLQLDEEGHNKKYPVLWLLHNEGGTALDWLTTPAEKCAVENGIFIIAPDAQHSMGSNMEYGPKYEEFLSKEFPEICRNNLPISEKPEKNWIGGVGTGAYGAVKAAIKYPHVFSACVAMDGIFDMDKICKKAIKDENTGIYHDIESLKAVFGDIWNISGSDNDVYELANKCKDGRFYMTGSKNSEYRKEAIDLSIILKEKAIYIETEEDSMDFTCISTMKKAVAWLCEK
ncbi:MAG TPA: alpha/beta hydrolase-fold protein [Lachnospiraceae bacterium]|nr:alpha/beta hydrolase-fold protein [Lachnospiraceae bacterium]